MLSSLMRPYAIYYKLLYLLILGCIQRREINMEHQWVHAYRNRKTHIANRKREGDGDDEEKISKYKIAEIETE